MRLKKIDAFTGYRTPSGMHSSIRSVSEVIMKETEDLGNTDILQYTQIKPYQIPKLITRLNTLRYTKAMWLCRSQRDVISTYCSPSSDCIIEQWEIRHPIVLSYIPDGLLLAFREKDIKFIDEQVVNVK